MADKSTALILDALARALSEPAGVPLYTAKTSGGLFAVSAAAKQAAQRCKDDGFLHILHTETKGKSVQEICSITDRGIAYLLSQVSPRPVLEKLVSAIEARQGEIGALLQTARATQDSLEAFKSSAEKVLRQLQQPPPSANGHASELWMSAALSHLAQWQASGAIEDCPLPELYRRACQAAANLSIGRFHDGLRTLHDEEKIYLHPWTGPLYEMPEPSLALLAGHEIAYYASRRL